MTHRWLILAVMASVQAIAADSTKPVFEGNQAVSADKLTGARKVEYPTWLEKDPQTAQMPSWHDDTKQGTPGVWYMIEGPKGLLECGGLTINPRVCREPTLGTYKWRRQWIVKKAGQWVLCAGRAKESRCAPRERVVFLLGNAPLE